MHLLWRISKRLATPLVQIGSLRLTDAWYSQGFVESVSNKIVFENSLFLTIGRNEEGNLRGDFVPRRPVSGGSQYLALANAVSHQFVNLG